MNKEFYYIGLMRKVMAKKAKSKKKYKPRGGALQNKGGKVISLKDRIFEGKNFPKAKDATLPKSKLSKAEVEEIQREALSPDKWWNQRATILEGKAFEVGRPRVFNDPETMWVAACEYFQYQSKQHWIKREWKSDKEVGLMQVETKVSSPFTIEGLCLFLGTSRQFFINTMAQLKEDDPNMQGFSLVVQMIENTIRKQKFEGAAVGTYKENLIAYDLGYKKDPQVINNAQANSVNVEVKDEKQKSMLSEIINKLEAIDVEAEDVKNIDKDV